MKPIKQRAKSPEQKAARRQQILDACTVQFLESSYEQVSMANIAERAGMTKAALYRYFRNKESLFLALYQQALDNLVLDARQNPPEEHPAGMCAELLLRHPLFCHLSAILHTVLERNLTVEEALNFKLPLIESMRQFALIVSEWLNITTNDAIQLIFHVQQSLIGCWHLCNPQGTMKDALELPQLSVMRLEFGPTLSAHLQLVFDGFIAARKSGGVEMTDD